MIKGLLFPSRCPICDGIVTGDKLIHEECKKVPRKVFGPRCMKCSKTIEDAEKMYCKDCLTIPKSFISGVSLYEYDSVKESVNAFKNENRCEYAKFYAREIYRNLGDIIESYNAEALIPIPLHKSKLKKREYNQATLLAKELSKYIKIPVREDVLLKTKSSREQKKQGAQERQNNVVGTFQLAQNDVKLKTIILIDDVYTTGSTIEAATQVLLTGGVERIYFITLAIGIGNS